MSYTLEDYKVGWISALSIEAALAKTMLDGIHPALPTPEGDPNAYIFGQIRPSSEAGSGAHNVVIACLPAGLTGKAPAATVANNMSRTFPSLKLALMVGIAGGVWSLDDDVRLGDVVVGVHPNGDPGVVQYDHGKTIQNQDFIKTGTMNKAPPILLNAISMVRANHVLEEFEFVSYLEAERIKKISSRPNQDELFEPGYIHEAGKSCGNCDKSRLRTRPIRDKGPVVHYGAVASGDQVMRNATIAEDIRKKHGILCFEMEAAGLDSFPCLVIRGISDYADTHKNDDWHRYAAAVAAAYAKEVLTVVPPTAVTKLPTIGNKHWVMPRKSNALFTGRTALIQRMKALLLHNSALPRGFHQDRTFILHGIGGAGKSETALRFCEENREKFWGVFWVDADTTQSAEQGFAKIAETCSLPDTSIDYVRSWLANTTESWLLVLDNCDDFTMDFADYLPAGRRGCVIVTTRLSECQKLGVSETLDDLDYEDSVLLLLRACGIAESDWQDQRNHAEEAIIFLGQHALALVHAGAYVSNKYSTLQEYPQILHKQQQTLMRYEPYQQKPRHRSVYATFETSAEALQRAGDGESCLALRLLEVLAFLHREEVTEEVFIRAYKECRFMEGYIDSDDDGSSDDGGPGSSNADELFDDTVYWSDSDVDDAHEISQSSGDQDSYIGSVCASDIPAVKNDLQGGLVQGVLGSVVDTNPMSYESESMYSNNSFISRCVSPDGVGEPNDDASSQDRTEHDDDFDPNIDFGIDRLRSWHCRRAYDTGLIGQDTPERFRKARARLFQLSLVRVDGGRGAISMHPLVHEWARIRMDAEDQQLAWERSACILALSFQPSQWSPIDFIDEFSSHVGACFRLWPQLEQESYISMNMGRIFYTFCQALWWVGSKALVEVFEELSGRLGVTSNSDFYDIRLIEELKGGCLLVADENAKAVDLFKRLVKPNVRLSSFQRLELTHLNSGSTTAYLNNERFRKKPSLFQEFVQRRIIRSTDIMTGMFCKENLAEAYSDAGETQKAIDLYEEIVKLQAWFFPTHAKQLHVQHTLAIAYLEVGKNVEAIELLEEIVSIEESTLNREHQDRLMSQHELARAYLRVGKKVEAIELLEEVVKIKESTLHREHRDRLTSRHELARAYLKVSKNVEAIELLEEVVKIEKSTLHREHRDRLTSRHELARAYLEVGKNAEAIELLEEVVNIENEILATDDKGRLLSVDLLACAHIQNDEDDKAVPLLEELVVIEREALANEDEERLISVKRLAGALRNLGNYERAEPLIEEVVDIRRRTLGIYHERFVWSQELLDYVREAMRRRESEDDSDHESHEGNDYRSEGESEDGSEDESENQLDHKSEDEPADEVGDEPNDESKDEPGNKANNDTLQDTPQAQHLLHHLAGRLTARAALMF